MRVPSSLSPDAQQALREVWQVLDRFDGFRDIDLHGRRIVNANSAIDPFDYITLVDVDDKLKALEQSLKDRFIAPASQTVLYGTHAQRLVKGAGIVPAGTLFYETDRAAVYQAQVGVWVLVLCRPLRTSDAKPTDLGTNDVGFTWFDSVIGVTFRWSGTAWNYYLGTLWETFANRPTEALVDRGFYFIAYDRGYHVWVKGNSTWMLMEGSGPTRGTLANITTGLGTADEGYRYYATDYHRTYRWSGTAWADAPGSPARYQIAWFAAAPEPAAGWALCDGSGATRSTSTGGTTAYTTPDLITSNRMIRANSSAGGTGGSSTHTHSVDPVNTDTSGPNSTSTVDDTGLGSTIAVASSTHAHTVDIAPTTSGAGSSAPPYYEALPYVRL